jgi:hypothetical protein
MEHKGPCPEPDESSPYHPRSVLILSTYLRLGLSSGLYFLSFHTITLCTPRRFMRATCHAHLILLDLIVLNMSDEDLHNIKKQRDIQAIHDPIVPADIGTFH